jgi:nucleoid-associated protein YgaU
MVMPYKIALAAAGIIFAVVCSIRLWSFVPHESATPNVIANHDVIAAHNGLPSDHDALSPDSSDHDASTHDSPGSYTIAKDDTLATIAKRMLGDEQYRQQIRKANPDIDPSRLTIGQVIALPRIAQLAVQNDDRAYDLIAEHLPTDGANTYHTVSSGDSLSTIAKQHYGVSAMWRVLYAANRDAIGPDPDRIKVGMKLAVPPAPTGKTGG